MTRRKRPLSDDDRTAWETLAGGIKPIKTGRDRIVDPPKPLPGRPGGAPRFSEGAHHQPIVPGLAIPGVRMGDADAALHRKVHQPLKTGCLDAMDGKAAEKMRKGRMVVDARLDLHGFTQNEAQDALVSFLKRGRERDWRCVLVITGKGFRAGDGGVLRARVPDWLNGASVRPYVVGFTEAQPKDGGAGAFYVRLRRKRD